MMRVLRDDDAEGQNTREQTERIPNDQAFTVVSHMDTDCETISIKRRQGISQELKREELKLGVFSYGLHLM
ncbi:hypothetical protein ABKV19_003129 [Rosa sericea]